MATAIPAGVRKQAINGQAAIALALLSAWEGERNDKRGGPTVEDVSERICTLLDGRIDMRDLGLRRIPGGVYSEEVETFVGHLLAEGLATHRSPIRLTSQGEKLLCTIIRLDSKEHPEAIRRAAEVLRLNASELLAGLG